MGYLSEDFWKGVKALQTGEWKRYESDGGFSVYIECEPNCLCVIGVLEKFKVNSAIPDDLLKASEILYEGWRDKYGNHWKIHSKEAMACAWSHKQVGDWLEKVGLAIERRQARACEFNCKPFNGLCTDIKGMKFVNQYGETIDSEYLANKECPYESINSATKSE
jgi:hypothetical protein